ncbi:hypothetical protein Tco_0636276 [Tanacetum coccineum]
MTENIFQIKERLKTARSRQKSYADKRRKPLEFKVGDRVLLKVSPWKGVVRFGKKGKLAPRYVGPFEIVECVGPVAYRLKLPQELSFVHDTFHVSNLKKCLAEPDVQVPLDEIEIDENLRFVEEPIEIVERDVKKLKRRRIPLVKVRWNSRQGAEYTWEHEYQFRKKYLHLFSETVPPSGYQPSDTRGLLRVARVAQEASFIKGSELLTTVCIARFETGGELLKKRLLFTMRELSDQRTFHIGERSQMLLLEELRVQFEQGQYRARVLKRPLLLRKGKQPLRYMLMRTEQWMERFLQPTNDPLALVSNASVQHKAEKLIESLSNSLALLTQSYKSHLPQTNNQLRTSSNARNKATVQDGRVVVQDVRGRYNANNQGKPFQRNNARGNVVAGNVGAKANLRFRYFKGQDAAICKPRSMEAPDFNSFFKIKNLEHQIQEKDNVIRNLKVLVANVNDKSFEPYNAADVTALTEQNDCVRVELEKVKQHYKELYDSIKITRTHTSEKTSTMLNEIESLKAQLRSKESCFTSDYVKPKVLAPGMYVIDVKPIPHPVKNNRSAHLNNISHLKESVETVREIVEEARVVKPLDNALYYACQYTKLSQELLEYVIGTCPKGVNASTEASESKPRSNTKKNRILPAKKENMKKVEGFAAALAVLVTGASQSRQHESHHRFFPVDTSLIHIESRKPPTKSLIYVGSRRISIFTVNTKEYHSDVLAIITRIMRRT